MMSRGGHGARGTKVAVVIPTHWDYRMGGSQYQAKLLIQQLHQSHGATITYFTARAGANRSFPDHQVIAVGEANGLRRFGHFWDYFRLQKALREFSPDIIYQRVGCAYTGISAAYARRFGIPLVWHIASAKDCNKAPALVQLLGRPHKLIEVYLAKRGAIQADVVVAQTKDQEMMILENLGRRADRLIGNFHEVPPVFEKPQGKCRVLWIANLKKLKRPELFIEIASQLKDLPGIEFVMVGRPYPPQSVSGRRFEELRKQHQNVKYLGAMPQDEVNDLLDRSHLLINTSESEGFSNTFVQAWMRSVPVLTLGVNPDGLLCDNFLGCSCDSVSAMANTVRRLASNLAMLEEMGKKSREYAVEHYSMKNAAELAELIMQAAAGNRKKRKN